MARASSLHIGLNYLDADKYDGWPGGLQFAEHSARQVYDIATACQYESRAILCGEAATLGNVQSTIQRLVAPLIGGDQFVITFSGHGTQSTSSAGTKVEKWCLFDGEFTDIALVSLLNTIRSGVRVLVISESCHGEGMLEPAIGKAMREPYIFLSACAKSEEVPERAFMDSLLSVWREGAFTGNYEIFYQEIADQMPTHQAVWQHGRGPTSVQFIEQHPFSK
jgi:metacaspase-1